LCEKYFFYHEDRLIITRVISEVWLMFIVKTLSLLEGEEAEQQALRTTRNAF